ncbi:MAG: GNAT family N-acetyltransferase, partial [Miltoncostaeaceae bacterium]
VERPGEVLHLDVPTANPDAASMARDLGMAPGFTCARMYRGGIPDLPVAQIFAAATLEVG